MELFLLSLCAAVNAWGADRAFKRREYVWAGMSVAICTFCLVLLFDGVISR